MNAMLRLAGITTLLGLMMSAQAHAVCVAPQNMTGTWKANDGGTYYVRKIGDTVWWLGMSGDNGRHWTNVYKGVMNGNRVTGEFADVPMGSVRGRGTLVLHVDRGPSGSYLGFRKVEGAFGGSRWFKPCNDVVLVPG